MALKILDNAHTGSETWPNSGSEGREKMLGTLLEEAMSAGSRLQRAALESPKLSRLRGSGDGSKRCGLLSVWEVSCFLTQMHAGA